MLPQLENHCVVFTHVCETGRACPMRGMCRHRQWGLLCHFWQAFRIEKRTDSKAPSSSMSSSFASRRASVVPMRAVPLKAMCSKRCARPVGGNHPA